MPFLPHGSFAKQAAGYIWPTGRGYHGKSEKKMNHTVGCSGQETSSGQMPWTYQERTPLWSRRTGEAPVWRRLSCVLKLSGEGRGARPGEQAQLVHQGELNKLSSPELLTLAGGLQKEACTSRWRETGKAGHILF